MRIPILMDTKAYPEADVGLITGSIRTEHDVEGAHRMRESCKAIVAFGTCPVYGGPQSSGYAHSNEETHGQAGSDHRAPGALEPRAAGRSWQIAPSR